MLRRVVIRDYGGNPQPRSESSSFSAGAAFFSIQRCGIA